MEALGTSFIEKSGETPKEIDLSTSDVIGIYFSAHWCPPCRAFTPQLADVYKNWQSSGKKIQIVFCSFDQDEKGFRDYFNDQPWVAIPHGDARIQKLADTYEVKGIPALIIINSAGKLVTKDGRNDVSSKKEGAFDGWAV